MYDAGATSLPELQVGHTAAGDRSGGGGVGAPGPAHSVASRPHH